MALAVPNRIRTIAKYVAVAIAVLVVGMVGYRYLNRPVQVWGPDAFENRNPDKVAIKGQGTKYWQGSSAGQGFTITDVSVNPGDTKTYCVSGGVGGSDKDATTTYSFGGQSFTNKNGFFTQCTNITVGDKHQISFTVTNGELQVYQVDRKR